MASPHNQWSVVASCFLQSGCAAFQRTAKEMSVSACLLKETPPQPSATLPGFQVSLPSSHPNPPALHPQPLAAVTTELLNSVHNDPDVERGCAQPEFSYYTDTPSQQNIYMMWPFMSPSFAPHLLTHQFVLIWRKRDDKGSDFTWLKHPNWSDQQEGTAGIQNWES